jgi:hypothetical protein
MTKIKLTRTTPGHYVAKARVRGTDIELDIEVSGPDRHYPTSPGYEWTVDSDTERHFGTLAKAREYINRFFEPVS